MPVVFPPELLDAITAQLDPIRDVKTIRACAMTFRDWNDVARPYIFRQVGIKNESDLRNFASIVDDAPGIGQVVQELVLRGTPHCTSTRWINLVGEDLPQRLPKVHTLTWLCLRLDQPCCPSLRSTLATFKAVTRFNLWQCTSPFQWLQTYITPLPSLRHLTIEDQTSHTKRPLQTQSGLVPELASLIIRDMHQVVLLMDWLLNSHSWEKSLRHLAVPATYMATPYLGQILQRSGSHLEHLDLDLCFSEYDNGLLAHHSLSYILCTYMF